VALAAEEPEPLQIAAAGDHIEVGPLKTSTEHLLLAHVIHPGQPAPVARLAIRPEISPDRVGAAEHRQRDPRLLQTDPAAIGERLDRGAKGLALAQDDP